MAKNISIAYSPDADDAFMFWALETGKLKDDSFNFNFQSLDTQSLNKAAREKTFDICAVSIGTLPHIFDEYRLLPHGGSVGEDYGPVVVCKDKKHLDTWKDGPVAIPGENTTAALVLRLLYPDIPTIEVPISPFEEAFNCMDDGRAIASLLIHEGRLTFEDHDCIQLVDIGEEWCRQHKLPLPLGGNVIRRSFDNNTLQRLNRLCLESIRYALNNKEAAMDYLIELGLGNLNTKEQLSKYLDMYANEITAAYSSSCYKGIEKLLKLGMEAKLVPSIPQDEIDGSFWAETTSQGH